MKQSVYIASLAFFIPLKKIRRKYINLCTSKMCIKTPFVHFPNAQCYYSALENTIQSSVVCAHVFYYKSRHNSKLDFKPHDIFRYFFNCIRYDTQEARQLEHVDIFDVVLDFRYQQLLCNAANRGMSIANNQILYKEVKTHFARYPTGFQLWLFLDNHDLNRFLFECNGNKSLFREGIELSKQWNEPWLMFYGTEREFTNYKSIFDGTPYADERVRMCITIDK